MANAMGNAARKFKLVFLPRMFRVKNAIRSRSRYVEPLFVPYDQIWIEK